MFRGVLTLALVVVIALAGFLYFRFEEEAQRLSEQTLNRYCAPFTARVGSASITPGYGVTMRNVEIVEQASWRAPRGVLQVDELVVEGDFDFAALLRGQPRIERVIAKTPRFAATRLADGSWNVASVKMPQGGGPTPRIELRDATVAVVDERHAGSGPLVLHHLDASVSPDVEGEPGSLAVVATARDTLARAAEVRGSVAPNGGRFELSYRVDGVEVSSELLASLRRFGVINSPIPPVRGSLSISGDLSADEAQPLRWTAAFQFASGEYRLANVKRPLSDIALTGFADNAGVRIDRGDARWGDSSVVLAGRRNGWSLFAPIALRCRLEDYDLASTPTALLPEHAAKLWERFRPRGRANVAFDLAFDGARFVPRATITSLESSFEDREKFPYRVTSTRGEIRVNGGVSDQPPEPTPGGARVDVDLHGEADGAPVHITAAFHDVRPPRRGRLPRPKMPMGWVEVSGSGIPITDRLVGAVPDDGARRFIQSLHPTGRVDVRWRAQRDDEKILKPTVALDMRLVDCRMLYDRFPYPLSHVTGWVRQRGPSWRFSELRSRDTQGRTVVEGHGVLEPKEGDCGFELTLTGESTPLDQTLYDALPADAQRAWAFVRPDGQIDFEAIVTRNCGEPKPRVRLKMSPHERQLTISPPLSESGYRYRLERVDGDFEWVDDLLTIRRARAEHGRTQVSTDGSWEALGGGAWKLDLRGLNADRLEFDRNFLLAAPPGLRGAIESLEPRGGFDLFDSRLEVTQKVGEAGPIEARWKVSVNCHQASIQAGVPIEGISGIVRLGGASDGAAGVVAGELDLDSVFWNDLQLTQVRGPVWANAADCFLGEGVARQIQGRDRRAVTAKAYGGDVSLNSWVRRGAQPHYGLAIGMAGVDVPRLASEWLQRPEAIDGVLDGTLELQGVGTSIVGLTGSGAINIDNADLYELPLFLSLLKYLRNRTPDNTAFNRLESRFTLAGEDIQFQNLDLLGDAVSLYGKGTATLQRDVDLTFASLVGRRESSIPVLKAFMSSASGQLLRLRVVGTADAPEVRNEVLPLVGDVLEQLQTEFGGRVTNNATRAAGPTRR